MNVSILKKKVQPGHAKASIIRLTCVMVLAGFSLTSQAGKITSIPSATVPGVQDGFGGFNLDNVEVVLNGTGATFDEATGAYDFGTDTDFSYESLLYDDDVSTTLMGKALAKDWPIGEPAGIRIINDDFDVKQGNPTNCILSTSYMDGHFLDEADPQIVLCSGPFQAHKRYKVAMLPTTIDTLGTESIDIVFNVEADAAPRDYQVYQKINNWTDERLKGFTVQVGFGTGTSFTPASSVPGVDVANLSLSVPSAIWPADQLANFSTGLFGPVDPNHGRPEGYFDPQTRAGFNIVEYGVGNPGDASGQTDILTSGATLGSDYVEVPAGAAVANQFGNWLPNNMLPYGIFFDDDGNPDTDAELIAWYGYNPNLTPAAGFSWMQGSADSFATYPDSSVDALGANPLYTMGVIDDLVNVGLNYVVTVGDVSSFTNSRFTIRITPVKDDSGMAPPTYVGQVPASTPVYTSTDAIITLDPKDEFVPGSLLTARVGDADLNVITDPADIGAIETTTVNVTADDGVTAPSVLTLEELGANRGVFAAGLPDQFSNVAVGTTVTVEYSDGANGLKTASSKAVSSLPAGVLQFNPASYTVAENGGSVVLTVERTTGSAGVVSVEYSTQSGTATGTEDYVPDTGTLTFADGESFRTITLSIVDDAAVESDEAFQVLLSYVQGGATLGVSIADIVITDDDTATTTTAIATSSSGGGFCSHHTNGRFDPVLPGLLFAAFAYFGWRWKKKRAD